VTKIGNPVTPFTVFSDARLKKDVHANVPGLQFVKRLRPVTFYWDMDKIDALSGVDASDPATLEGREIKAHQVQTGFLAQEVEAAAKASDFEFSGVVKPANDQEHYRMSYETFVVPLVKAVQEQQSEIEQLHNELAELKAAKVRAAEPQHAGLFGESWAGILAAIAGCSVFGWARRTRAAPNRA
jgi:hypothetical protein